MELSLLRAADVVERRLRQPGERCAAEATADLVHRLQGALTPRAVASVVEPVTGLPVSITVAAPLATSMPKSAPMNGPAQHVVRTDRPSDAVLTAAPVSVSNLTHLVYGSPNQPETLRFFTDVIGFEISDQIPGVIAFTRCGEVHHNLAVQGAPVPFVHHIAFEVDSLQTLEAAKQRLLDVHDDPTSGRSRTGNVASMRQS